MESNTTASAHVWGYMYQECHADHKYESDRHHIRIDEHFVTLDQIQKLNRTEHLYTETEHIRARLDQYAPFWFWAF